MKVRLGFVSNSSSSSFTCLVCGEEQSGWDLGLGEAGMCECVNGHVFCESHKVEAPRWEVEKEKLLNSYYLREGRSGAHFRPAVEQVQSEEEWEALLEAEPILEDEGSNYDMPERVCPICSFAKLDSTDGLAFVLKTSWDTTSWHTKEAILAHLKATFPSYKEFKEWLQS